MNFGKYLTYLRQKKGLTKQELATKIGVTATYVSNFEHERNKPPKLELCVKIADALKLTESEKNKLFSLSIDERVGNDEQNFIKESKEAQVSTFNEKISAKSETTFSIPLLGTVPADNIRITYDHVEDWIEINKSLIKDKDSFALRVKGDCLEDEKIFDGDLIFVSKSAEFVNGKICVVRVDGQVTCKKVFKNDHTLILQRASEKYPDPIVIDPKKQKFEMIGRVVGSWSFH